MNIETECLCCKAPITNPGSEYCDRCERAGCNPGHHRA